MVSLPEFERDALPLMDAAYNLAYWLLRNPTDAEDVDWSRGGWGVDHGPGLSRSVIGG